MEDQVITIANPETGALTDYPIENWVQTIQPDGQTVTIIELKDNMGMYIEIRNPEGSGRRRLSQFWLSRKTYEILFELIISHELATGERALNILSSDDGRLFSHSPNVVMRPPK